MLQEALHEARAALKGDTSTKEDKATQDKKPPPKKKKKPKKKKDKKQPMATKEGGGSGVHEGTQQSTAPSTGDGLESVSELRQALSEEGGDEEEEASQDLEDDCPLCLDVLVGSVLVVEALLCGHRFHTPCLDVLVEHYNKKRVESSCPMCRGALVRVV